MKILDLSLSQNLANGKIIDEYSVAGNLKNKTNRLFGENESKVEIPKKVRDIQNCRGYIIKILGLKDYSCAELQIKASKLGYTTKDIQSILDQLTKDNWINDERLAANLVECYAGRKGKSWLQQKLNIRMIDKEVIAKVLNQKEIIPDPKFKRQVEIKYNVKFGEDIEPKIKQKIISFVASKGFGNVFEILKQWQNGEG